MISSLTLKTHSSQGMHLLARTVSRAIAVTKDHDVQ
jgi:hypothetical protein